MIVDEEEIKRVRDITKVFREFVVMVERATKAIRELAAAWEQHHKTINQILSGLDKAKPIKGVDYEEGEPE